MTKPFWSNTDAKLPLRLRLLLLLLLAYMRRCACACACACAERYMRERQARSLPLPTYRWLKLPRKKVQTLHCDKTFVFGSLASVFLQNGFITCVCAFIILDKKNKKIKKINSDKNKCI